MNEHSGVADTQEAQEDAARAGVYRLLGTLLANPPGEDVLALLRDIRPFSEAQDTEMLEAWAGLREAAGHARSEDLEDEFNALFIGLGKGELSPYMSWYVTGFLMEKPLAELRSELARLGYATQEGVSEPEDHVVAICEVMGMNISENGLSFKDEKSFFDHFVSTWMADFFRDLSEANTADFYKAVGRLGAAFMRIEHRYYAMPA